MPSRTANRAIAAASLSSASPSTSRVKRPGAPTSRKIAITAAGSVVATAAPSSKHTTSGTPAIGHNAKPITAVVTRVAMTARNRIGAASSIRRRTSVAIPASNTRGGRKT
jgi:hypothetical protein